METWKRDNTRFFSRQFVGMMASGHGLRDLYPITAGLTVIGYQDGSSDPTGNILLSVASILFILAVTFIIVFAAKNREVTVAKKKKKNSEKMVHKRNAAICSNFRRDKTDVSKTFPRVTVNDFPMLFNIRKLYTFCSILYLPYQNYDGSGKNIEFNPI